MGKLEDTHAAYALAARVDKIINKALAERPAERVKNRQFWEIFNRTVGSTLNLIDRTTKGES